MKEYKVIRCKFEKMESNMNLMANQGWIVKAVNYDSDGYSGYGDYTITFEREKG